MIKRFLKKLVISPLFLKFHYENQSSIKTDKRQQLLAKVQKHSVLLLSLIKKYSRLRKIVYVSFFYEKIILKAFAGVPQASKPLKSDLREARKHKIL